MASLRLGVLASGRGSNFQAILDAIDRKELASRVVVLVTDRPGAMATERAKKKNIPTEFVPAPAGLTGDDRRRAHDAQILKVLRHFRVNLVVLAGYMRIVSPVLIQAYPNRIVNIHPALLPKFPGMHAQRQALEAGEQVTGCTTHFVDEQVDHGPIILQAQVPVKPGDTEETLSARILEQEHRIFPETIRLIEAGRVRVDAGRAIVGPSPS